MISIDPVLCLRFFLSSSPLLPEVAGGGIMFKSALGLRTFSFLSSSGGGMSHDPELALRFLLMLALRSSGNGGGGMYTSERGDFDTFIFVRGDCDVVDDCCGGGNMLSANGDGAG